MKFDYFSIRGKVKWEEIKFDYLGIRGKVKFDYFGTRRKVR